MAATHNILSLLTFHNDKKLGREAESRMAAAKVEAAAGKIEFMRQCLVLFRKTRLATKRHVSVIQANSQAFPAFAKSLTSAVTSQLPSEAPQV